MVTAAGDDGAEAMAQRLTEDDKLRHLTTLEGWRRVHRRRARRAGTAARAGSGRRWATVTERSLYDEDRLDYHTRLAVVATPALRQVVHTGRRLTLLNRHAVSARRGLIVSGAAGTGKTTAITQLGKTHEADRPPPPAPARRPAPGHLRDRPARGDPENAGRRVRPVPRPATAVRGPTSPRSSRPSAACVDTRISLVCVDEIHNLDLATRAGAEVSDTAQIPLRADPGHVRLRGHRRRSARDCSPAPAVRRSPAGSPSSARRPASRSPPEWQGLVATLEDALRLHRHRPGTLARLDRYLHQRTGGMIGSLSHLIRGAAIDAILDGSEQITRKLLDTIELDHAAQTGAARRPRGQA